MDENNERIEYMSQETVDALNELFALLAVKVQDKQVRHSLEKLNKRLHDESGGVIAFVNWNS